jgi:endonuclease IV
MSTHAEIKKNVCNLQQLIGVMNAFAENGIPLALESTERGDNNMINA